MDKVWLLILSLCWPLAQADVPEERTVWLRQLLYQDCGSCHGLRLTGGLAPPLTVQALAERAEQDLAATIRHGRPGTPMPPWQGVLSEADIQWLARTLKTGEHP